MQSSNDVLMASAQSGCTLLFVLQAALTEAKTAKQTAVANFHAESDARSMDQVISFSSLHAPVLDRCKDARSFVVNLLVTLQNIQLLLYVGGTR